jgi:hypothetical protein
MEECGQEGRGPTWAVAPTRRRRRSVVIMCIAVVIIITMIISAWSWKKINCSMMGEAPSCSLMFSHVIIVLWSLNPMHLSATLDY